MVHCPWPAWECVLPTRSSGGCYVLHWWTDDGSEVGSSWRWASGVSAMHAQPHGLGHGNGCLCLVCIHIFLGSASAREVVVHAPRGNDRRASKAKDHPRCMLGSLGGRTFGGGWETEMDVGVAASCRRPVCVCVVGGDVVCERPNGKRGRRRRTKWPA